MYLLTHNSSSSGGRSSATPRAGDIWDTSVGSRHARSGAGPEHDVRHRLAAAAADPAGTIADIRRPARFLKPNSHAFVFPSTYRGAAKARRMTVMSTPRLRDSAA